MPREVNLPLHNVYVVATAAGLPDQLSRFVLYNCLYDPGEGVGLYYSSDESTLVRLDWRPVDRKVKDADETVNNSNTLQDDDELAGFALVADKRYRFEIFLQMTAANAIPNAAVNLNFSQTPQLGAKLMDITAGTSNWVSSSGDSTSLEGGQFVTVATGSVNIVRLSGYFQANATTGGTLALEWAQSTAHASDTKVLAGAYMVVEQLD